MAIGVSILDTLFDEKAIAAVEMAVDAALVDREWMMSNRKGASDHPYWDITVSGSVTPAESNELIRRYEQVGWGRVIVSNSGDHGERPGIIGVTLFKHKPNALGGPLHA